MSVAKEHAGAVTRRGARISVRTKSSGRLAPAYRARDPRPGRDVAVKVPMIAHPSDSSREFCSDAA
jgi:hypothetical protein